MKKSKLIWLLLISIALLLSFPLAGIISNGLLQPITKLLWWINQFYLSINQAILWGLLLISIAIIAGISLQIEHVRSPRLRHRRRIQKGEVSQLAFWIRGTKHTYLARWHVARMLAELAVRILANGGADIEQAKQLQGRGWEPPEKIRSFLLLALHTTAVTFRNQKKGKPINPDPDIISIVKSLESYLENAND